MWYVKEVMFSCEGASRLATVSILNLQLLEVNIFFILFSKFIFYRIYLLLLSSFLISNIIKKRDLISPTYFQLLQKLFTVSAFLSMFYRVLEIQSTRNFESIKIIISSISIWVIHGMLRFLSGWLMPKLAKLFGLETFPDKAR